MRNILKKSVLSLGIIALLGSGASVFSETDADRLMKKHGVSLADAYPKHPHKYLNDYAEVIRSVDKKYLEEKLEQIDRQTGIEATVLTINSIHDYRTPDNSIEEFATNLFNAWGIGSKTKNNGMLLLVAVKDRKCRIELGAGYGRMLDDVMKRVVDEEMVPNFKKGDMSAGIVAGTDAMLNAVTKKTSWLGYYKKELIIGFLMLVCIFAGINCLRNGKKGWGYALFAMAGMLLLFLLKSSGGRRSGSGSYGGGGSFGGGFSGGGGASGSW